MMRTLNEQYELAKQVIPGGVNSSTRFNRAIGTPIYASRGKGSRIWDIEDREIIDMCCAHGASLLGYAHPAIDGAVSEVVRLGYLNSFETVYHEMIARKVCEFIPCAEKVRFCSSGSEATLHLIRVCRAFTGRKKIIRFEGHFHGYHEMIYIGGQPPEENWKNNQVKPYIESPGIPEEFADLIIPVPFNDFESLHRAIERHWKETALVIVEPVNFNTGGVVPQPGYLELLRKLTKETGIILFFDEILSSFRKSIGGAQQDFGITPDVCTIGKALGGGLPLSAFCGKAEIMDRYKPTGNVQHSGTFNGHLIPIMTGLAFLNEAAKPEFYQHLQSLENHFHNRLDEMIIRNDLNMVVTHHGARFNIVFGRKTLPMKYEETFCHKKEIMWSFVKGCWDRQVYFHDYGGKPAHHGYSVQHTIEDIDKVLDVIEDVLKDMKSRREV
ncbi:MAG: aminotransferase class III-fold pyridoxal phosphate-dependent enzyme [Bacillota bacterium]|nr:aminotransferase class III-fold pyridoxal phosphate-dependent enzyme [Bacillota bacterium]